MEEIGEGWISGNRDEFLNAISFVFDLAFSDGVSAIGGKLRPNNGQNES